VRRVRLHHRPRGQTVLVDDEGATFTFDAVVWEHDGQGAWHFLALPPDHADEIEHRFGHRAAGFGSLRVEVTIGSTTWRTSIFPDKGRETYVLPVKKAVRVAEGLHDGATASVRLDVVPLEGD
jgi:hypothetical protein